MTVKSFSINRKYLSFLSSRLRNTATNFHSDSFPGKTSEVYYNKQSKNLIIVGRANIIDILQNINKKRRKREYYYTNLLARWEATVSYHLLTFGKPSPGFSNTAA